MQRMPSRDWTRAEVEAAVADYLDMLVREVRGETFNKAQHNRELRKRLDGRSKGAVEFKHANISAVLLAEGFPPIDGYKPRGHVQAKLREAVQERREEIERLIRADVEKRQPPPVVVGDILGIKRDPPGPSDPRSASGDPTTSPPERPPAPSTTCSAKPGTARWATRARRS